MEVGDPEGGLAAGGEADAGVNAGGNPGGVDPADEVIDEVGDEDEVEDGGQPPNASHAGRPQPNVSAAPSGAAGGLPLTPDEQSFFALVPEFVRMCIMLVLRKNLPSHVQSSKTDAELIAMAASMIGMGFLDHAIAHYTGHLDLLRTNPDAVRQVFTVTPLSEGQTLAPDLLAFLKLLMPATAAPSQSTHRSLRPKLPEPGTFTGPTRGQTKLQILKSICSWIDNCTTTGALANLPEPQLLIWAVTFLRGEAATWWAGEQSSTPILTFSDLRNGLVIRFVGTRPFELLCGDLEGRKLSSFPKFAMFKSWFGQTVAAMRVFAESGRMWPDSVLIDKLMLCLEGTKYHSGVVQDRTTLLRPTSLSDAFRLLDDRHSTLLMRGESQDDNPSPAAPRTGTPPAAPKPPPGKPKRPAAVDASTSGGSARTTTPKRAKVARLPLREYIGSVCPRLDGTVIDRHMADGREEKPLTCPLCRKGHFITKCPAFEKAKGKRQAEN